MTKRTLTFIAALMLSLVTGSVHACGESLFRVGKGVAFRQYTAPIPGSILAVANTDAELMMIEQLAAAGHDVHVVSAPEQLRDEMGEHEFDIVLAYYSQRDAVKAETADAGVTYIPVAMRDTDEERQARQSFERSLSSDDSVKTFLKTIHKTLKARG